MSNNVWERVERSVVYDSPGRARYPSIARTADGLLLVLFTQQTSEQEWEGVGNLSGGGDLMVVRSADGGSSWSDGSQVHRSENGEPRAVGTMTVLNGGRIIAPFAEMHYVTGASTVRVLNSEDGGTTWQACDPEVMCPLTWWAPCGRVVETRDGTLVMPVYGTVSEPDLVATIHGCGLLRSADGGESWGDFSWIARGGGSMVGAAPQTRFSFEGPFVQPLPDGRWLAMVTARRLNRAGDGPTEIDEGPGTPQALCRLWSKDEGRTWTDPDQLMPGAWPSLSVVGDQAFCANTFWGGWAEMRLEMSDDGFVSISRELKLMVRGWTVGRENLPQEAPLPPTVPYLAWPWTKLPMVYPGKWPFEHYGFPSVLPLGQDRLMVAFSRPQCRNKSYPIDPPDYDDVPVRQERIQAVFYRRLEKKGSQAVPVIAARARPRGRWVLADRIIVEDVGSIAQGPHGELIGQVRGKIRRSSDGGRTWKEVEGVVLPGGDRRVSAFGILSSGRWLAATVVYGGVGMDPKDWGVSTPMGMRGGYPVYRHSGVREDCSTMVSYSDTEGKTWHQGVPFKGPFKWALPTAAHFLESRGGTVSLPIFGCVTDEELDSYSSSNGVIRSADGGESWDDFSFVFRTNPKAPEDHQPEPRYSEMDLVELPNGHWIAYSRHEVIGGGPNPGATAVALSTDHGRTWVETGGSLEGVSQQMGVLLPDGGIALTYRTTSWQAAGVAITYDEGRSFAYLLTGPYETRTAYATASAAGKEEFVVFSGKSHRSDMLAGVYRLIPGVS